MRKDALFLARFWSKVDVREAYDCWPWRASVNGKGYGRFGGEKAHRVAYRLVKGPIPEGLSILHRCDNPPCCNPRHLRLGTALENTEDALSRGRLVKPPVRRKLSQKQIADIRKSKAPGAVLAGLYGVAESTISMVRTGYRKTES